MSDGKLTALYSRLSKEDFNSGESNSIENQKHILQKYAEENGFENTKFYVDDGVSGVSFDRPSFNQMMEDIESGKVGTVITKDLSRIGRDHVQVGMLTETKLPSMGVRFIAVNDGYDTADPNSNALAIAPFYNIINEFWVRQTSQKVRASYKAKAERGEWVGTKAPYGYMKDPAAPAKHLVPDPETAPVVMMIFDLCAQGKKISEIAEELKQRKIPTPSYYYFLKHGKKIAAFSEEYPYTWAVRTIADILGNSVYIGYTQALKTEVLSYKVKKRLKNSEDKQIITPDTHEAIIDQETWEIVSQIRSNRKRVTKSGYRSIFSGLAYCADCGAKLTLKSGSGKKTEHHYFLCSSYRSKKGRPCTIHSIREDILCEQTLVALRLVTSLAVNYEEEFRKLVTDASEKELKKEVSDGKKKLTKAQIRLSEVRRIVKKLYEDNVNGKISDDDFKDLNADYSAERKTLEAEIAKLETEISAIQEKASGTDNFIGLAKKHTDISKLSTEVVNLFIEKIFVHEKVKAEGKISQKIEFVFKGIGKINIGGLEE